MNPASLPPGTNVGPWRVVRLHGRGSYGAVYRVERTGHPDATPHALKLALHPLDPRFEREAELLSRIHHPCVPRLENRGWWGLPGGAPFPYLVMEWIDGVTLYEWTNPNPLTSRQALRMLAQVAWALAATHAAGGVHRDVKGDNVLVRKDGTVVLMDFGSGNYKGARTLTHRSPPPGTPLYQSPESFRFQWQWRASPTAHYEATPADDLYALGVTAYRLVTGRYPPPAVDVKETQEGSLLVDGPWVPPETWVSLSPKLAALIHQLLSPEPSDRGSTEEVAQALERAARRAGRMADRPIGPVPFQAPTARASRPAQRPALAWSRWLAVATGLSLLLGAGWRVYRLTVEAPAGSPLEARGSDKEDAGTAGLGEAVPSTPASVAAPEPARAGISLDMPKKALPGQRRPPCGKHETEINGGCWIHKEDAMPPCGTHAYEWKNACYWPLFAPPRPTTSEPP